MTLSTEPGENRCFATEVVSRHEHLVLARVCTNEKKANGFTRLELPLIGTPNVAVGYCSVRLVGDEEFQGIFSRAFTRLHKIVVSN